LKWLPGFRDNYLSIIRASGHGQPSWLQPFFHFWASAVQPAPGLFAILTALAETAICLPLLLGIAQRAFFALGTVFALMIWAVGEGFGGPYMSGSTDIGCAIMYSALFVALLLAVPRAPRSGAPLLDARIVGWRRSPSCPPDPRASGACSPARARRPLLASPCSPARARRPLLAGPC
jgi:uncharacterized membrane protein YphA (DoxX/SURF4 family)